MPPYRNLRRGLVIAALVAQCCLAQQDQPGLEGETTEGWILKEMMLQGNAETKIALLDQFRMDFEKAELIIWAYDQICDALKATNELDRALAVGEKLLALDPQAVEIAQMGLRLAEKKKDAVLIRRWSDRVAHAAQSILSSTPADASRVEFARAVLANKDYLAYAEIVRMADPAKKRERMEQYLQGSEHSSYKSAIEDLYLETWRESGDAASRLAAAKRIIEKDDSNVVALTIVAEAYFQGDYEPKKLMAYATKILALLDGQPKPEGLTAIEWSRRRSLLSGRAHWMAGNASLQQEHYGDADKFIRAALPHFKSDSRLTSAALFYLGWANYRMGNFSDAIRFNKQCALVKGPFQAQAARNLEIIRAEAEAN